MSDVENLEHDKPDSPSGFTEEKKLDSQEAFSGSPEHEGQMLLSEDGKPFVGMEGELDFEVLEEQIFSLPNEADSQASKTIDAAGEDGSSTALEKENESKNHGMEDGEDDGECSDDEDLEEGEVKDENETVTNTKARQHCRFFSRGMCFYGIQCRFLHLNSDTKGNYNMFQRTPIPRTFEPAHMMLPPGQHGILHRSAPRSGPDFIPVPPMLPAPVEQESAWEKGLREAKELLKKANQRKEEPDFEEKRLTLSLSSIDRNVQVNDKENDKFYKKKNREDVYKYGDPPTYNRANFGSRYENFEIRYTNVDRGLRSRRRGHGFNQREDNSGHWKRNGDQDFQKLRADEFFDPWRRSKSPKHRRSKERERSRSFGGSPFFSSVSSYSSRSSSSRSSSSVSRGLSSRSPSPVSSDKKKKNIANKTVYPLSPKKKETPVKLNAGKGKKKPGARTSSSRSRSRGRSIYSSRSSRSLSMDSVSSASSSGSLSHSSREAFPVTQQHVSILRRQEEPVVCEPEALPPADSGYYFQIPRPMKVEKMKQPENIGLPDNDHDPLEESFQMSQPETLTFPPSVQHLMPTSERERAKDPIKGLHPLKQQIKLTLLNKNPQSKLNTFPKKEIDLNKGEESLKMGVFLQGVKRPLSPPVPLVAAKPQPAVPKKSASSRRDELLKQLKAVEDAIARKRAKFC